MKKGPKVFWVDLFCGAGGTSTGIHLVNENTKVIACVNHDANAIKSHKANHPDCEHFTEDIRDWRVIIKLKNIVKRYRKEYPGCIINIWASLECIHFSRAKGGQARDADSRTLAEHLYQYIGELNPDYLYIENVVEFMSWGPLDKNGKPISTLKGKDYVKWKKTINNYGYHYSNAILNAADFGAFTSRNRYFGVFAKEGLPIAFPEQTHIKRGKKNPEGLINWMAVKEVLDLEDEGFSIFTRKKDLAENTLKRIYAGLIKFVAGGVKDPDSISDEVNTEFLMSYYGNGTVHDIKEPCNTLTTKDRYAKLHPVFLLDYQFKSLEEPCPTILSKDKVQPKFFVNYYSSGGQLSDLDNPSPTIMGVPKQRLTTINFIDEQYGQSKPHDIDRPSGAITANPKQNLVSATPWIMDTNFNNVGSSLEDPNRVITANRKHHYLVNPQFSSKGASVDQPSPTIIARQDKSPLYIVNCDGNTNFGVMIFKEDCKTMIKIKEFMATYGLSDIKMRMLRIDELLRIQGFPEGYELIGTKTEQKKYIGNSVVPLVAQKLADVHYRALSA